MRKRSLRRSTCQTLSEPKPIEEKPNSTFLHEEPLLYPRVYPADYSYDFDEESINSDPLSESEFIEEPILEKFISTYTHPPLTKTWFTGEPFQPYREFDHPLCDFVYEYYDELFEKHWTEKSFPRRERDSTHEREEVNLPNPEEVKRRREKLEYISAISSREWLREIEGMDQLIQLYPELKALSCQVGNLSYQDEVYDPRVDLNIIPKSLVLEVFPDEPLSFSQKRLQWISSQTIETEGILRVVQTKIGESGIFLHYHIFDIPKGDPPFILVGRPIEEVLSSVLYHENQLYHLEVRATHLQSHRPEVKKEHVWSMDILEVSTLDSQNRLEHEGFPLEGSQIPCSHQKFPELSMTFMKHTTSSFSLCMLTLKGRL
jgi:hypothetical protein